MNANSETKPGQQRFIIVLLIILFAAPILISWWMLKFGNLSRTDSPGGHGFLIQPARPLPDMPLFLSATDEENARLHGKWNLVYLVNGSCGQDCESNLYKMRQLRLATGKYAHRIQRVLLVFGENNDGLLPADLIRRYEGQLLAKGNDMQPDYGVSSFEHHSNDQPLRSGRLYVIDPLGNLMMSYSPDADPDGIIKDLKRLLKYSRIG